MSQQEKRSIPISRSVFEQEEMRAVQRPLEDGWVVQGPRVKEFEDKFCSFTNAKYSVATTSCTTALHIAVAALGLKPGEEVIVPGFTWIATANAVEYMGATPVFCDIDLSTYNIDPQKIEPLITERTVGIIPVHLFGLCADMDAILKIAKRHKLWVVEDAACGFGAWYKGSHAGTFGDAGCFSFHPRKAITTGEGGMITTADSGIERRSRCLRNHGAAQSHLDLRPDQPTFLLPDYDMLGYNFRMTDIQGALGCAQMDRAAWMLAERERRAGIYDEELKELDWLETPVTPADYVHGFQSYVCLFCPEKPSVENVDRLHGKRNEIMSRLEQKGIATRQGTHAITIQEYYAKKYHIRPEHFLASYLADRLSLALPLFPQMSDEDQNFVCESLKNSL